jgi:hypothetical protein
MQRTTCKPRRSPSPARQPRTRFRFFARALAQSPCRTGMDRCAVLQKAYDVLSNPKLRRTYDSVDEFDDSIPDDKPPKTEADFYKAP